MQEETKLIHAGRHPDQQSGMVNPPIHATSTIIFPDYASMQGKSDSWNARMRYGRAATPTMLAAEAGLAALEHAHDCRLTPSGLAAIFLCLMSFAEQGKNFLISDSCYEPTRKLGNGIFAKLGVEFRYFNPNVGADIEALMDEHTALVFMESPGSLTFELQDIPAIVEICKQRNIPTAIDNTWASGWYLKPLNMGVDVSLQSATKYIGGASDLLMGFVAYNDGEIGRKIEDTWLEMGSIPGPEVMNSAMRGLRSMPMRLNHHQAAGLHMAEWLEQDDRVAAVIHPAFTSHPQHHIWKRDFSGSCGLFSIVLKDKKTDLALANMLDPMRWFKMGYSWGGYESLILPVDLQGKRSISSWTHAGQIIRLHIGQENLEDLKQDLHEALNRWEKA